MGGVATIAVTVAAAAGAVALFRYIDRHARELKEALRDKTTRAGAKIIDYERDPERGIFRQKR
ncbi:MAG: hypothetical protein JKX88_03425 [Marinicaulis sp.]|nr:hypothetical protein [Marinicaulis sp.]